MFRFYRFSTWPDGTVWIDYSSAPMNYDDMKYFLAEGPLMVDEINGPRQSEFIIYEG